jgi:FkbM family methyltransferase
MANPYQFLEDDLDCELTKRWSSPSLETQYKDDHFSILKIGNHQIFWPSNYGAQDLPWLYNEVFLPAQVNPHAYEWAGVKLAANDWVIDAGACEGFFTWYALDRGACVLVVEPVRALCDALSLTFANQIKAGRVRILHGCLGKEDGVVNLAINPGHVCESKGDKEGLPVPVHTVDSIMRYGIIPKLNFLKMDIEGAEMEAVAGAVKTMQEFRPKLSIAVYHAVENAQQVRDIAISANHLYSIGYRGKFNWDGCTPRPFMLHAS